MTLPRRLLCFITDEDSSCPVELARMALAGGAGMVQLRRKKAYGRELYEWAVRIQELCRQNRAIFIVNDRVDIALAMHADGVHLGQQDLPVEAARHLLGKDALIGVSVSSPEEAASAAHLGASYLGVGHIYMTGSKEKSTEPIGTASIRPISQVSALPVIAIGGITRDNASLVMKAGASGIAVISAISANRNPEVATRELITIIRQ
ncbi:MAG: thiamine phosphate synthase [Chlorobiaceae bacterium]|nr:thiamine phosphate synthase [Chlorobiaceae bacterium]